MTGKEIENPCCASWSVPRARDRSFGNRMAVDLITAAKIAVRGRSLPRHLHLDEKSGEVETILRIGSSLRLVVVEKFIYTTILTSRPEMAWQWPGARA